MKTKLRQQGGSLIATLPKAYVEEFNLKKDDEMELDWKKREVVALLCRCGTKYFEDQQADHTCTYEAFFDHGDLLSAQRLLRGPK